MEIKLILKTKNLIIIEKPCGMPSQPDPSGDMDAMTALSVLLKSNGEAFELHIINRLDRVVGGLILFARNKKTAAYLSGELANGGIKKEYLAVIAGRTEGGRFTDFLYKDARISKSFIVDKKRAGVKEAVLDCLPVSTVTKDAGDKITLVRVRLYTGRYHQIRCQLSGRGNPIIGDGKYGSRDKGTDRPALFAYKLSFVADGEHVAVSALPSTHEYPWNLFDISSMGDSEI